MRGRDTHHVAFVRKAICTILLFDTTHTPTPHTHTDYVEGSFSLMWKTASNTAESEVSIDPQSTATLYEMGMSSTPLKMTLYIRDYDGTQPVKVEHVSVSIYNPVYNYNLSNYMFKLAISRVEIFYFGSYL